MMPPMRGEAGGFASRSALRGCILAPVTYKLGNEINTRLRQRAMASKQMQRNDAQSSDPCKSALLRKSALQPDRLLERLILAFDVRLKCLRICCTAISLGAALLLGGDGAPAMSQQESAELLEYTRTGEEDLLQEQASVSHSSLEDNINKSIRQLETKLDSAAAFFSDGLAKGSGRPQEEQDAIAEEGRELIKEVWEIIDKKYVDARGGGFDHNRWDSLRDAALAKPLKDRASAYRAIREMLANGLADPYTRFITTEQFAAMQSYDITGVGLNICTDTELEEKTDYKASEPGLYILGLISRSAASQAGLQQGDRIIAVDGIELRQESPFQAAALIAGPEAQGAPPLVTVQVKQANSGLLKEVQLQRPAKDPSPVHARLVEYGGRKVGQIRLDKFVARTQQDVASAVQFLAANGAEEYILDLRNNLGGLVEEGVEVARLFLDGDLTIVNRLDSGGLRRKTAAGGAALTRAPITLLVNEHTASASEILAGALRDNCRAVLVGQRTFGKGLIQGVFQLEDGSALAVTIGKYLTPARTDIDREGIRPDFGSIPEPAVAAARLAACKVPVAA